MKAIPDAARSNGLSAAIRAKADDAQRGNLEDMAANVGPTGGYAPRNFPGIRKPAVAGKGIRDNPSAFRKSGLQHGTRMVDKV